MRHFLTTLTSRLGETDEDDAGFEEGSVRARIDADLDRFKGIQLLPGVLEQVRGHLHHWWGEGFAVEEGASPVEAHVYFNGNLESLRRRGA